MTDAANVYCIDTSSLLQAWVRAYPPAHFASLWGRVDQLVDRRRLITPEEVLIDLEKKEGDDLYAWAKERRERLVIRLEEEQQRLVGEILAAHPLLVEATKHRSGSDPFVIALARHRRATVVTEESRAPSKKPKIPSVCAAYQIAL